MRLVIQRVTHASVEVEGKVCGNIQKGLLVLIGIHKDDLPEDTLWLVNKLVNLRVFEDEKGKMNLSIQDVQGEILVVSQFTLYANFQGGRRPDFLDAARGSVAEALYLKFVAEVRSHVGKVHTGIFGADMKVSLCNEGPVTLILDSPPHYPLI